MDVEQDEPQVVRDRPGQLRELPDPVRAPGSVPEATGLGSVVAGPGPGDPLRGRARELPGQVRESSRIGSGRSRTELSVLPSVFWWGVGCVVP
jgi:hypothetical protein